jgi:hypothetical protein
MFKFLDTNQKIIIDKVLEISTGFYDKKEEYTQEASSFMHKKVMQTEFKELLYEQFDKFVDKDSSLEFIADDIFAEFDIFIEKSFTEFVKLLASSNEIKEIIINYEDDFNEYINIKSLLNTLDTSVKDKLTNKINSSLLDMFYGQDVVNEVLSFFTKGEFTSSSKLSDMINGLMPKIIENNLHLIIEETIIPALKEQKPLIKTEIMQKVPFGIGWAVQRDVGRAMNIIIDTKIPEFMEKKIKGINDIIQEVLNTQLADFGYSEDIINQKKVDDLMKSVLTNKNFESSFAKSMNVFVDTIFNMKLKTILQIFNITKISELYDIFEPNIKRIMTKLEQNVSLEQEQILSTVKNLAKDDIGTALFEKITLNDLLNDVDKNLLLREFEYLEKNIKATLAFEEGLRKIISDFIQKFIKEEFLNMEIFKNDIDMFLKEIIKDKEQLRVIIVPFFKEFIANFNDILDLKLKNHMLDIIVESAFDSIDKKIIDLIGAIDFKKVITKEIQEMHPKELEDMFYSFAGPYFNKLILYGLIGFFFGLGTIL